MPLRLTGDWEPLRELLDPVKFGRRLEHNVQLANRQAGVLVRDRIKRRLVDQKDMTGKGSEGPGKLHPFTVHRRNTRKLDRKTDRASRRIQRGPYRLGRGRPHKRLIDRGQGGLLGAIAFEARGMVLRVGVQKVALKGGHDLARIQEDGAVIRVTPKMRGWLHAKGLHLKPSTTKIEIPGQQYMKKGLADSERLVFKAWDQAVEATIQGARLR